MHRIEARDHEAVRPIFGDLDGTHLHITAVLDGNCPGQVYGDDTDQPRTACLRSGDCLYLVGAAGNAAFDAALNAALPRDHYFVLFYDPGTWEGVLDGVLEGTYAVRAARRYYTLRGLKVADWQDRVPEGYSMQPVDAQFLARGLENMDSVVGWLLDGWRSVDTFLGQGFGSCLVRDTEVVSWSLVDYIKGDRCEMGIETAQQYQRRGLGTLTAAATAAQAVERGFATIGWHCWANNAGSMGVAGKVGFEEAAAYDVFINHWPAENVTDMTPDEYCSFAESYEREFQVRPPGGGYPHIVAATAWALSGDRAGCFRHLNRAVDIGWLRSVGQLRQVWPELFRNPHLDEMREWRALARRLTDD
jgi:GNAT superfamily N-acetyltransferase